MQADTTRQIPASHEKLTNPTSQKQGKKWSSSIPLWLFFKTSDSLNPHYNFGIIVYQLTDYQQKEILQDQQMYTLKVQTMLMN